jgi:hypothetical protein
MFSFFIKSSNFGHFYQRHSRYPFYLFFFLEKKKEKDAIPIGAIRLLFGVLFINLRIFFKD